MDDAKLLSLYEQMIRIVAWERVALRLRQEGKIVVGFHSGRGQEAVAVGAIAALRRDDYIMYSHRGFGYTIAKGMSLVEMFGDMMGNTAGSTGGLGAGIPHFAEPDLGILGQGGTLGTCFPIAAGAGFSARYRGTDQVVVCFFGEGTANRGTFHEAANAAAAWRLPVVWVCENNGFAVSVRATDSTAGRIADRAAGYGMPGSVIDGMDVEAVHAAVSEAVERARAGGGPTLLEAECYRFRGHFAGDPQHYRTEEEAAAWAERDPIPAAARELVVRGAVTEADLVALRETVDGEVEAAAVEAGRAPLPGPERLYEGLYT